MKRKREEKIMEILRDRVEITALITIFLLSLLGLTPNAYGDEIVHKFKNPSFSGIGTGAHYLTIENQEHSRKKAIEEAITFDWLVDTMIDAEVKSVDKWN